MRVKFGRAAFVDLDMRLRVADDAAVRWAKRRESQRVCSRSRRNPERGDFAFEQLGKRRIERFAESIAVIGSIDMVGAGYCFHHLRVNRGGIV